MKNIILILLSTLLLACENNNQTKEPEINKTKIEKSISKQTIGFDQDNQNQYELKKYLVNILKNKQNYICEIDNLKIKTDSESYKFDKNKYIELYLKNQYPIVVDRNNKKINKTIILNKYYTQGETVEEYIPDELCYLKDGSIQKIEKISIGDYSVNYKIYDFETITFDINKEKINIVTTNKYELLLDNFFKTEKNIKYYEINKNNIFNIKEINYIKNDAFLKRLNLQLNNFYSSKKSVFYLLIMKNFDINKKELYVEELKEKNKTQNICNIIYYGDNKHNIKCSVNKTNNVSDIKNYNYIESNEEKQKIKEVNFKLLENVIYVEMFSKYNLENNTKLTCNFELIDRYKDGKKCSKENIHNYKHLHFKITYILEDLKNDKIIKKEIITNCPYETIDYSITFKEYIHFINYIMATLYEELNKNEFNFINYLKKFDLSNNNRIRTNNNIYGNYDNIKKSVN